MYVFGTLGICCDPSTIPILDVRVNFINRFLLTETYNKETNIHQYLNPLSCHPPHIFRSAPKALGITIRRNCSDRYESGSKFIENLREFKGYLVTSEYDSKVVSSIYRTRSTLMLRIITQPLFELISLLLCDQRLLLRDRILLF